MERKNERRERWIRGDGRRNVKKKYEGGEMFKKNEVNSNQPTTWGLRRIVQMWNSLPYGTSSKSNKFRMQPVAQELG